MLPRLAVNGRAGGGGRGWGWFTSFRKSPLAYCPPYTITASAMRPLRAAEEREPHESQTEPCAPLWCRVLAIFVPLAIIAFALAIRFLVPGAPPVKLLL